MLVSCQDSRGLPGILFRRGRTWRAGSAGLARLRTASEPMLDLLRAGRLRIAGARHDLDDGRVEFLDAG